MAMASVTPTFDKLANILDAVVDVLPPLSTNARVLSGTTLFEFSFLWIAEDNPLPVQIVVERVHSSADGKREGFVLDVKSSLTKSEIDSNAKALFCLLNRTRADVPTKCAHETTFVVFELTHKLIYQVDNFLSEDAVTCKLAPFVPDCSWQSSEFVLGQDVRIYLVSKDSVAQ